MHSFATYTTRAGAALLVACLLLGCQATNRNLPSAAELDSQALEHQREYVIGARDQLAINVWKQPELTLPRVAVRTDGKISFPLVDDIQASGKTPTQLKEILTERLTEFVTAPHVTVVVLEIHSKLVYVLGEVVREGPVVLGAEMRVVDAISIAGGFTPFAGTNRIKLIRNRNGSGPTEFVFDYDDFVSGQDLEQNVLLAPGDRLVVPDDSPFWK